MIVRPLKRPLVQSLDPTLRGGVAWDPSQPASSLAFALGGFAATDYYQCPNNLEGTLGQAAGFWIGAIVEIPNALTGNTHITAMGAAGARGYSLRVQTATLRFRVLDGVPANIDSPTYVLSTDAGAVVTMVGVHDGSFVRLYINGTEVGSGTAITGYTAPSGTDKQGLGAFNAAAPWGNRIIGVAGGHDVPTAGEVATWHSDCRAANDVVDMAGVTTDNVWSVRRGAQTIPSTWTAQTGSENMAKAGTALTLTPFVPRWS